MTTLSLAEARIEALNEFYKSIGQMYYPDETPIRFKKVELDLATMDEEQLIAALKAGQITQSQYDSAIADLKRKTEKPVIKTGLVKIEKETDMSTVEEMIKKHQAIFNQRMADLEKRLTQPLLAIPAAPPQPANAALEKMDTRALIAAKLAGQVGQDDYINEMKRRAKATTSTRPLGAAARAQTTLEKAAGDGLIIGDAMVESIERQGQLHRQIATGQISKARFNHLQNLYNDEAEFQIELLGSSEAVAKFYDEFLSQPKQNPREAAWDSLQKAMDEGDGLDSEIAATWAEMEFEKQERAKNEPLFAVRKAQERTDPAHRQRQLALLSRMQTS